jgi:hypothetical protein
MEKFKSAKKIINFHINSDEKSELERLTAACAAYKEILKSGLEAPISPFDSRILEMLNP